MPESALSEYKLGLKAIERRNNYWLLEEDGKRFALWKHDWEEKDTENVLECLEFLNKKNLKSLPGLVRTADKRRTIPKDGKNLFLSSFPDGEACDSRNGKVVQSLTGALFEIHEKSKDWRGLSGSKDEYNYIGILQRILFELLQYKKILGKKRFHRDFELIFLEHFDFFYSQGQESLENMNLAGFGSPKMDAVFLLNSFVPRLIFTVDQQYVFSDMHRIGFGPRVKDLALLLNSFMPIHAWNMQILKEAIEKYQEERKLSPDERHILIAQLRFPGRYWLYALQYLSGEKESQPLEVLLKDYILEWRLRDKSLDAIQTWLLGE